jgi:regulation of enolase protein 1 (concanavalin A-like superfamily)
VQGAASHSGGTFTVRAAGADIWGTTDAFRFTARTLAGDGEIVARVSALSGTDPWAKAGVMLRQSLDAGSAHGLMLVSLDNGLAFQRRTVTGGGSASTAGGSSRAPVWVRLKRQGQVITAAMSSNGTTWTTVGTATTSMVGHVYVGLAVTSHTKSATATATFDNVTVR